MKRRLLAVVLCTFARVWSQSILIDHRCADITLIPQAALEEAKATLHIAYGHTSHGGQITNGMIGLAAFADGGGKGLDYPPGFFVYNNGGTGGALDLEEGDGYGDGWLDHDCGYYPEWVAETREYLDDSAHADVNVLMWSWCGQLSYRTEQELIDTYLIPMAELEADYPQVTFVYMTGHLDGTGETGNLHLRNQQIRQYCLENDKVLYDFADIESYAPDGSVNYMILLANDGCDYDSDGDGTADANWAQDWQAAHTEGLDWYEVYAAHSESLNGNLKAYATWWLFARLVGWEPPQEPFTQFTLRPNFPNPFSEDTTIKFETNASGAACLCVFDMLGREVCSLTDHVDFSGKHETQWDGRDAQGRLVPSGVYLLRLEIGGLIQTTKMVLAR